MKTILSFDPGGTTGWAFIGYEPDSEPETLAFGQIPNGHLGFIDWWNEIAQDITDTTIVCESFTLRQGIPGVNLEPCYVMGALQALYGREIVYQSPMYKGFCDNDGLKNLGFYIKGQQHARDAFRHAAAYLRVKEKHIPTLRKGWPNDL